MRGADPHGANGGSERGFRTEFAKYLLYNFNIVIIFNIQCIIYIRLHEIHA